MRAAMYISPLQHNKTRFLWCFNRSQPRYLRLDHSFTFRYNGKKLLLWKRWQWSERMAAGPGREAVRAQVMLPYHVHGKFWQIEGRIAFGACGNFVFPNCHSDRMNGQFLFYVTICIVFLEW
jgi:hypothetical protein